MSLVYEQIQAAGIMRQADIATRKAHFLSKLGFALHRDTWLTHAERDAQQRALIEHLDAVHADGSACTCESHRSEDEDDE